MPIHCKQSPQFVGKINSIFSYIQVVTEYNAKTGGGNVNIRFNKF